MNENRLTGVILSGGKSSRMGFEKGLADFQGNPLISYAIEALKPVTGNIIIGANRYLAEYKKFGYHLVQDEVKGIGPLGGLFSALKYSKTDRNLLLSCDMPFVSAELLAYILQNIDDYQVVVPVHNGQAEPLCGFYHRSIIPVLEKYIEKQDYKMRNIFQQVLFKTLEIDSSLPFYNERLFFNVNGPEDLNI